MLAISWRIAPPAIVGDDYHHFCSVFNEFREKLPEDRLITDYGRYPGSVHCGKYLSGFVCSQAADRSSQVDGQFLQELKMFVSGKYLNTGREFRLMIQLYAVPGVQE